MTKGSATNAFAGDDMKQWARLVVYERQQMIHACRRLWVLHQERAQFHNVAASSLERKKWQRREPEWQVESNAFLESFCIHYRNLQDFLSPRKSVQSGDVTAGPFLGESIEYRLLNPNSPPIKYRDSIDKSLTHMSKQRTTRTASEKQWHFLQMQDEMDRAWRDFLAEFERVGFPDRAAWFALEPSSEREPTAETDIDWTQTTISAASTASTYLNEIT